MNTDNGRESYSLGLDINQMLRDARRAENAFQSIGNKAVSEGEKIDKTFRSVGAGIAGYFAVDKILEFGKAIIDARGEIESFQISFDTLLGDKDKSAAFFSEMKDFAVKTPLLLNDLAKGGQLLLGFGVDADKVMPTLKQIGDISMGNADRFNSLALAFAQMSATGKLMGQDLLQMVNAGFNPLQTISEKTGKSIAVLKDEMSKGAISSDMVAQAFEDATAKGGKFNGMLEKQSKGIKGSISNLQGAIQDALNGIGESNQSVITEGISLATTAVKNYEKLGAILAGMIATYGMYRTALIFAMEAEKGYTIAQTLNIKVLLLAEKAQKLLNKTMLANPYVLAAVALGLFITALIAFHDSSTASERAQERYNKKVEEANELEQTRKERLEALVAELQNELTAETRRVEILGIIKREYPAFFKLMLDEKGLIKDLTEAWKGYNEQAARGRVQQNKKNVDDLKKVIYEEKRFLELMDMNQGERHKTITGSKSDKEIWTKYSYKGTYNIKKDIETNEQLLLKWEKNVQNDSFNQWQVDLKKKTDKQIDAMRAALVKRAKAANGDKSRLASIGKYIQVIDSEKSIRKEKSVTYDEKYNKAKTNWENAKKALSEIEKDKKKFTEEQYINAKKLEETTEKAYKDLGGETGSKLTKKENAAKKSTEEANELKVEKAEREKKIADFNRERINQEKQSEFQIRQSKIDSSKEGFEKEKEQINLNYDRLIEENRLRQEQWVKELQDKEYEEWINKNPNYKKEGKIFTPTSTVADLSTTQQDQLKEYTNISNEYQKTANDKLLKDLFDKYKNFEQRRTDLNKQFNLERKAIENGKTADGKDVAQDVKDAAIVELEKKRKDAIKSVNDEEVATMQKSSDLLVKLFEDASNKSVSEINKIVSDTEQLMSYLSRTKSEDITPNFGFSTEQLQTLKASPEQIKAIQKAVEELYSAGVKKNPFSALVKGIKDLFKSGEEEGDGKKSTEAKLAKIGESAAEAADMVGNMAGSLSKMFEEAGNDSAAEAMSTVQNVMSAVSNIGQGFAKGGIVGGIAAAVGEAANFIGQAFAASARHQAALKEIMKETIAQQREYNLLLMQQNLEYAKGDTIFGSDSYGKAANAVKVLKEATADLNSELAGTAAQKNEQKRTSFMQKWFGVKDANAALKQAYAGLADIEIKTGHEKTGLFGWGKGKDIYSSILGVYPELIDANGKFNASLAETIISTKTMSDEDKAAFQNMIDLSKQAEEALQAVKDYLTGIFGELGNTMSDALVDAFKNGTDAAEKFSDAVSDMLEKLAKEMIYSVTIAPLIEQAQEKMLGVMQNENLTDDQKFNNYVSILDGLTSGVLGQQDMYNGLLKKYQQMAADKGVDIFQPDEEERKASSKSGISASQDSIDESNGRLTAIQGYTYTINENLKVLVSVSSQALEKLSGIEKNTSAQCEKLDTIAEKVGSVKTGIDSMNTRGVILRKQ